MIMAIWQNITYCVHTVTKPYLTQTGQHHSNLPVGICGAGGEGIPHDGEERPAPYHHLLNERKVTPLALPCNHGDSVPYVQTGRYYCPTIPGNILTLPSSLSHPESRWFLLVVVQPSSSQNMASQTDTWQDLWKDTTIVAILVRWFIIRGWAWASMHNFANVLSWHTNHE